MKVSKTLGLLLTALLLSSSALAAKRHFSLQVDTQSPIAPGESLTISLASLDTSSTYDVHCTLNATGFVPIRLRMDDASNVTAVINDRSLNFSWDHFDEGYNQIDLYNVNAWNGNVYLKNKDWSRWWGNTFYLVGSCDVQDHAFWS